MRREKDETISSQAVPSPERQRLTRSAPLLTTTTFNASNAVSPKKQPHLLLSNKALNLLCQTFSTNTRSEKFRKTRKNFKRLGFDKTIHGWL
jgi:hypothetical protein